MAVCVHPIVISISTQEKHPEGVDRHSADNVRKALTMRFRGRQCTPFGAMEDVVSSRAGLN